MSIEESERITTSQDVISRLHDKIDEQQARIAELESQLDAIGAGSVEPLRKPAAAPKARKPLRDAAVATQSADRTGTVYVSGPMTGYADWNFPAFNAAAADLRAQGLRVINPADHGLVDGAEWADYLRTDLVQLLTCERIHLLPGWRKSKGAQLELHVAKALGLQITLAEGAESLAAAAPQAAQAKQGGAA